MRLQWKSGFSCVLKGVIPLLGVTPISWICVQTSSRYQTEHRCQTVLRSQMEPTEEGWVWFRIRFQRPCLISYTFSKVGSNWVRDRGCSPPTPLGVLWYRFKVWVGLAQRKGFWYNSRTKTTLQVKNKGFSGVRYLIIILSDSRKKSFFFEKKLPKNLDMSEKMRIFAPSIRDTSILVW